MKIITTTCWSHALHIMSCGPLLSECTRDFKFSTPRFDLEGVVGYIETELTIDVKDIEKFAELYTSWFKLNPDTRTMLYAKAKNENPIRS